MNSENHNNNLHKNASSGIYENAKELRQRLTDAEKLLWEQLRNKKVAGLKFRRQHPFDKFIADFYCHEKKLVVELDGSIHDEKEIHQYDEARTYDMKELGVTVIRFRNEEVVNDIKTVIEKITKVAESLKSES